MWRVNSLLLILGGRGGGIFATIPIDMICWMFLCSNLVPLTVVDICHGVC